MEDEPFTPAAFQNLLTGRRQKFVRGPRAEIHSDFNHTGQVDFSDAERAARHERPGSILLPVPEDANLGDAPHRYLTPVHIHPSGDGDLQADELVLRLESDEDDERVLGHAADRSTPVLGDHSPCRIRVPPNWSGHTLQMRATTLPGDPAKPGPVGEPLPPEAQTESGPNTVGPGEVWVRLRHRRGRIHQPDRDDVALFQMAPLILQSNLEPTRRLYVVSGRANHSFVYDVMEACWDAFGADGPFQRPSDRPFPVSTPEARSTHANEIGTSPSDLNDQTPQFLLSPDKMYLIDGNSYWDGRGEPDWWIQDQMTIGYCSAPGGRAVNVALHCKRTWPLAEFVDDELLDTDDSLFSFSSISAKKGAPEQNATDYGGNIAVSPPVEERTDADDTPWAGPRVPAHPPAPHGKIILGDCRGIRGRSGLVHEQTRRFLQSQTVQPIIPIDTSWLEVGHVDEILTFVPGSDGPKLVMADPEIMKKLLKATKKVPFGKGRTHFHRGGYTMRHAYTGDLYTERAPNAPENRPVASADACVESYSTDVYDETSVEAFCAPNVTSTNEQIRRQFLDPIERRLCNCTGMKQADVLPLPVYFEESPDANSRTPNLVNMQVLKTGPEETHLLVPRPCGPRLRPDRARTVVRSVLKSIGWTDPQVCLPQTEKDSRSGFQFWAWQGLQSLEMALFFTRKKRNVFGQEVCLERPERNKLLNVIRRNGRFPLLPKPLRRAVQNTKDSILAANDLSTDLERFSDWHRLFIPENTVDVLEAYTASVFRKIDCNVHFVDAWLYHTGGGGLHCGTNVLREPPPPEKAQWWTSYRESVTTNTTYDP